MDEAPKGSERPTVDVVDLLKYVGSPIAVGAALLFYFGWARSNQQAQAYGVDISVFEMSFDDLALRSVNVIFVPLLVLLLIGLIFLRVHPWIKAHAEQASRLLLLSWVLIPIGLLLSFIEFAANYHPNDSGATTASSTDNGIVSMLLPLFFLLGIAGTAYGARLRRHARGESKPPLAQDVLIGGLLVVTLFWATERVARATGDFLTQRWQNSLASEPGVLLFSEAQLHIEGPGVIETPLTEADGRYAYKYEGLHFLQRSGDKYFLVTAQWNGDKKWAGRLLVLPDDNTIRLEFTPLALPAPSPSPASTP